MADVSGVSGSGGAHHTPESSHAAQNQLQDVEQSKQFEDSLTFLQQELARGLAAQKAIMPDAR